MIKWLYYLQRRNNVLLSSGKHWLNKRETTSNNTPLVQKEVLRTHDSYQNSIKMFSFYNIKINGKTEKQMENTCVGVLLYYKDTPEREQFL